MASAEHRKNMMLRWINRLKRHYVGRVVNREIFLVDPFRPACFNDDPKKWAGEAFALCVQKKILLLVDEKRGTWKFFNTHEIPNLEIMGVIDTSLSTPVVCGHEDVVVESEHEHCQHDKESEMKDDVAQASTPGPMTEERLLKLPGMTKMLVRILKSIYLLVGSSVFRYSDLRPSMHGYRNDKKDQGAFKQMVVKARSLGIIVGTDEQGNLHTGPRGVGCGKFVAHLIPAEWSVDAGTVEVVGVSDSSKSGKSTVTVEHHPSADLSNPVPVEEVPPAVPASGDESVRPSLTSDVELERLRLENAVLKGQVRVYKKIIAQFINNLRGGST